MDDNYPSRAGVFNSCPLQQGLPAKTANGVPLPAYPQYRRRRPLEVDQALPYSPFSSIVPFSADFIPLPSLHQPRTGLLAPEDRAASDQMLRALDSDASDNPTSNSCRAVIQSLQNLLQPEDISEFKFKSTCFVNSQGLSSEVGHDEPPQNLMKMSPFEEMILESTRVTDRHRPSTIPFPRPGERATKEQKKYVQPPKQLPHQLPQLATNRNINEAQNFKESPREQPTFAPVLSTEPQSHVASSPYSVKQQPKTIPASRKRKREDQKKPKARKEVTPVQPVVLPTTQPEAQLEHQKELQPRIQPEIKQEVPEVKFEVNTEINPEIKLETPKEVKLEARNEILSEIQPEAQGSSSKKVQGDGQREDQDLGRLSRDEKEKADAAVRSLQEHLQDIFETEDQMQTDSTVALPPETATLLVPVEAGEGTAFTLTNKTQVKLDTLLSRVLSFHRLSEIPIDSLSRIQKLCEPSITSMQATELDLENDFSTEKGESWLQQLSIAELGLLSSRTVLKIMTGGLQETQLYPEELLQGIIDGLSHVFDHCFIPIAQLRSSGRSADVFRYASSQRKILTMLFHHAGSVIRTLSHLISTVEVAERAITTIEFLSSKAVFAENVHVEKDSVLGIQKYEALRRSAMDLPSRIFSRYTTQRTFILDEILTSLEKLPSTRQSARQFKLVDGKSIQLITALIMQLVQTSAAPVHESRPRKRKRHLSLPGLELENKEIDFEESSYSSSEASENDGRDKSSNDAQNESPTLQKLQTLVDPLYKNTIQSTQYIVKFFVQRALTSTKSGDQPYRQLLDIFTEDLINVLGSTDWPSAEILLRVLMLQLLSIADNEKSPAPAKNMALELLGWMASGISDLTSSVRQLVKSLNANESKLNADLIQLMDRQIDGKFSADELFGKNGPFEAVLEYMTSRNNSDLHLDSACSYLVTTWAESISSAIKTDNLQLIRTQKLASHLGKALIDIKSFEFEQAWGLVSPTQARISFCIIILNQPFCRAFEHILKVLLGSISSDQATVRSRSLKSIIQMLEKDASLLDRGAVTRLILKSATDQSPMVRDSALSLIGKCMLLKPALEEEACKTILASSADAAIGVRKRAMKLLKDIYLRNSRIDIKAVIADSLIQRLTDPDEGVVDLARQTFEEIWMTPFYASVLSSTQSSQTQVVLKSQCNIIIKTVQRGERVASILELVLKSILSSEAKFSDANHQVCRAIVANMFDDMLDSTDNPERNDQRFSLQALAVFARADAKLFTPEQMKLLQPYLGNLTNEDLPLFRCAVTILRCVLPHMSVAQSQLLHEVQNALFRIVQKLQRPEMHEAVSCLWSINKVLKNIERLARLTISVLKKLDEDHTIDLHDSNQTGAQIRIKILIRMTGVFGRYCNFDETVNMFRDAFPRWKGNSVPTLMIDLVSPFANCKQPLSIRAVSLDALGSICQAWPRMFEHERVKRAFTDVFDEENLDLQDIVLKSFRDFSVGREKAATVGGDSQNSQGDQTNTLGGSMLANDTDGASAFIVQGYLAPILRIALATQDSHATSAAEFIASINKQGLIHPKACLPTLVALETSSDRMVSNLVLEQHRNLHQQHESILEKEYMKAVYETFLYQKNVANDPLGVAPHNLAKLHNLFDVIKISNSRYVKRFLSNLCRKIEFESDKQGQTLENLEERMHYSRFILENIALFEYGRLDELQHVIVCIEKLLSNTGTPVAQSIECDVFQTRLEPIAESCTNAESNHETKVQEEGSIEPTHLLQLAIFAIILSVAWETRSFLRRLYGLSSFQQQQKLQRDGKAKPPKDMAKAPTKNHSVTPDKYLESVAKIMQSLDSRERMIERCKAFAEILAYDNELKIGESDDDVFSYESTSIIDEGTPVPSDAVQKRSKRKSSMSLQGSPKKARSASVIGRTRT